jgi:hypothetical protein
LERNEQQRIECNASYFKDLGAVGTCSLSASHANAFTSLSYVAGNQVWINHLTRLQQPMSNPTNEPSCEPIREPTKRMDLNALLSNNLSQINNAVLSNHSKQQVSFADQPGIDEEINYSIAASEVPKINGICQHQSILNLVDYVARLELKFLPDVV